MKLQFLILCTLLFSITIHAQTFTANKLASGPADIQLDASKKIVITGVKKTDKDKYIIKDDAGADPVVKPKYLYNEPNKTLILDIKEMAESAVAATAYVLHIPGDQKKNLKLQNNSNGNGNVGLPKQIKGFTGIAFWDSKAIKNNYSEDSAKAKIIALGYINRYAGADKTWKQVLDSNPFFRKVGFFNSYAEDKTAFSESTSPASPNILGSLGGLDVTKYVQAFADFLRDRIKEELTVAYLDKLKRMIETSEELQYLLPKTRTVFLSNDAFNIPNMGATYKAAFAEDLQNLMPNFEKMVFSVDKDVYKTLRSSDGFISFLAAYHFVDMSAKSYHPADILRYLNQQYEYKENETLKTTYAIAVLNMFSQNLLDTSGKKWIDRNLLRTISKDEVYMFLGLLYEKYPVIFNAKIGMRTLVEILSSDLTENKVVDKLFDLLLIINTVDDRIKGFKESSDKGETVLSYFINNADALIELVDYATDLANIKPVNKADYYKWKSVIEHTIEGSKAIKENDLGKLGVNVITIINELVPADEQWKKNLTEFIKILTDITNAKTSDDIKALLDNYAAPVHSYRVARMYKTSAAFASYPGIYGGLEYNAKSKSSAGTFGVTAPIGFSFSRQLKDSASASLFISVFDIGAALSYRFNNDTTDLPSKIYFGQIFSPGIFAIYGFKKSPLALKFGVQYAPLLREIKTDENIYKDAGVWRASLAITVDVPVFILSRKK